MKTPLKYYLFDLLPSRWLRAYFKTRGFSTLISSKVIDDLAIDITIHKHDTLWNQRLSKINGHEIDICRWFKQHLKSDDIVFDVGACFGFFGLLIQRLMPKVIIHAFQPMNYNYFFLKINALASSENRWSIFSGFVSDKSSSNTISLDDYCQKNNTIPSIVKMDIDGPEFLVLQGAKTLLEKRSTIFLVEVHPEIIPKYGGSIDELLALIPEDYVKKVLLNIREDNNNWSSDLSLIHKDRNPYLYFAPKALDRFSK